MHVSKVSALVDERKTQSSQVAEGSMLWVRLDMSGDAASKYRYIAWEENWAASIHWIDVVIICTYVKSY